MSTSRHPIALRLERRVGGATRLLATVMALPLVDGLFPALVLAGALSTVTGIVQTGLLVFGGSATVAVILAEMDGTPREQVRVVLGVGVILMSVAAVEAALAPTIESLLNMEIFKRFAALVIAAVAARTASARVCEYLPRPAVIVSLGLVASLDLSGAEFVVRLDPVLVGSAVAAAGVGVTFAMVVALLGPTLRDLVDIDRFRFGSAVALGLLPLSILGYVFGPAPLAVLGVTTVFALDPRNPERKRTVAEMRQNAGAGVPDGGQSVERVPEPAPPVANLRQDNEGEAEEREDDDPAYRYNEDGTPRSEERAPWL